MRRMISFISMILCCIFLSGCWNYKGLDDIDIVTGLAIDKDQGSDIYQITIEIVDTQTSGREGEISAKYIDAEGRTIFDAIRNSKKKLINKLYGGNMQTLIISKEIAEAEGVSIIIEELLRDGEPRETMSIVISEEETAKEILLTDGIDSNIISYEIHEMITEDNKVTASTVDMPLYQTYNSIKGNGKALVLPVVRRINNINKNVVEGNGIALFKDDYLHGFLSPRDTMYYLFIVDKVRGGVISFPIGDLDESISMEIKDSKTDTKISSNQNKIYVDINVKVKLNIMEVKSQLNISNVDERDKLETQTEEYIEKHITELFEKAQSEYEIDIFGLGNLLYKKDPDLWRKIETHWDELFQSAVIKVKVEADIISSGVLKNY